MTKIRAFLIHEVSGFDASFKLFKDALYRGGIEVIRHVEGREDPKTLPWCGDGTSKTMGLDFDVLFLGSLHCKPELSDDKLKDWAECIKRALDKGAGLVAMLDDRTDRVFSFLDVGLHVELPVMTIKEVKDITFRPVLTKDGKTHEATQNLTKLVLPPFGSIDRSYYRTLAHKDAKVLMEVPEYIDQKPTISEALVKHTSTDDYRVRQAYPFVVVRNRIAIMAADWCNTGGQEFVRWPHASIWLASLACAAAGLKMKEPNLHLESEEPSLQPKSEEPAHWFLKEDRKYPIEQWRKIECKLSTPWKEPATKVEGATRAVISSSQVSIVPCDEEPSILENGDNFLAVRFYNGMIVRLGKAAMQVRYCQSQNEYDEVVAAADSTDEELVKIFAPWPWQQVHYMGHGFIGERLEVIYELGYDDDNKPCSYLFWTFIPARKVIEGVEWTCIGEQFALKTPERIEEFYAPQHRWQLGDTIEGHSSYRFACYPPLGKPRGFRRVQFKADEEKGDLFHWFYGGQPFQILTYEGADATRTLWCYTTTVAAVRSELRKAAGQKYIEFVLSVALGRQTGNVQLPTFWYCFAEQGFSHNLWLAAYDHVRQHFRQKYGIKRTYPRPTAMLRYNFTYLNELRHYADTFVPLAKELGIKRIDCGVHCVADLFFPLHGGIDALRYLCDKAHAAGIEVMLYSGATWMYGEHPSMGFLPDAPAYHGPDWFVWESKDGPVKRYAEGGTEYQTRDGVVRRVVRLSLRSGWYQYSLDQYAEIKKRTGVDGVWLDSWTWPNQDVNYAEPTPKPAVVEAMQYVADLQKLGYTVLVEGQSPAALESFWYRQESYAPLQGNEFSLSGMSPFALNGDGLLDLDPFRLLAYGCAMFQDIRLLADATDDVVSEMTKLARACNKMMNSIHEKLGMPRRVRELSINEGGGYHPFVPSQEPGKGAENSPVGTFWECERGIAIFGFQTVLSLDIDLGLPNR